MADKSLDLFENMSMNPNSRIYMIVFKACAQVANERAKNLGRKVLDQISIQLSNDAVLTDSAVHMLMRFSDVNGAEQLFNSIKNKNVIRYGSMMQGNDLSNQLHPIKFLFRLS